MNRILLIFLITYVTGQAQSIYRSDQHLLFKEAKSSQTILILKDSLVYKGNPLRQKTFLHSPYLDNLKSYSPFQIGTKNYLVHDGCGSVLEWRNDSIVRIDHSFLHHNQINSVRFVYKNEIYFFGGYGLFTFKNLLTKYSFKSKEWDEIETFGTPPSPRQYSLGLVLQDDFYVFSGYEKDSDHFLQMKACEPVVYKLHLPTMQWSELGKFNTTINLNSKEGISGSFTANEKLYILPLLNYTYVYEIDFKNNTIVTFKGNTKNVTSPYFDAQTKEVVYLNKNADGLKEVMRSPIQEFLGKQVDQHTFILPWYQNVEASTLIITLLSLLGLYSIGNYFKKRRRNFTSFSGITYNSSKEAFYCQGKLLDTFEETELRILDYLIQNSHHYISLNELNHLFENEIQSDNFTTVVKRREVALSGLLAKLQFITSNTEKDILMYRRSPNDKRVKEIKLKEHFIRVK
jgi:hypothetical protein